MKKNMEIIVMYKGSTPQLRFDLPIDTNNIEKFRLTFAQKDRVLLEKTEKDITKDGKKVYLTLRQEDTLKFDEGTLAMQIKLKTMGGDILYSDFMYTQVKGALNVGVL